MGKIAFVFAGQGAQYPGMGQELYLSSMAAKKIMDQAEAIRPGVLKMCFEGSKAELDQTINTQPCLYTVDYACAAALREQGIEPDCVAGFSLGEVAAAAFAGMMSFEAGFQLVIRRAERMQKCALDHPGGMMAILKLASAQIEEICAKAGEAWPVNYNCAGQIVVACSLDKMDLLMERVRKAGGRALKLNVSGAFHSPYMMEAAENLAGYLKEHPLKKPQIPIYANRTALPYAGNEDQLNDLLAGQVCSPVRWQQTVERMRNDGTTVFVEAGAGTTLCGLIRKTDSSLVTAHVENSESLEEAIRIVREEMGC